MYGMMCVVYTTGLWLLLASFLELPVSTTHSTVGGIVGMAITYGGADCVLWYEKADMFPYLKGVSSIVASWALSPVFSGIIAVALFFAVRTFVLRSANSYKRAIITFPFLVMITVAVNGKSAMFGTFMLIVACITASVASPEMSQHAFQRRWWSTYDNSLTVGRNFVPFPPRRKAPVVYSLRTYHLILCRPASFLHRVQGRLGS